MKLAEKEIKVEEAKELLRARNKRGTNMQRAMIGAL
jgi:hypothetical protein